MNPPQPPRIREAGSPDRAQVVDTLVSAFGGYGLTEWVVLSDARRVERMRSWFGLFFDLALPHGMVYTEAGNAGAVLWFPPGAFRLSWLERLRLLPRLFGVTGAQRFASRLGGLLRLVDDHPAAPHFYLEAIGTVPGRRGRGVASALLEQGLSRCDREGVPAFLHTSNPAAVPFYEKRGFETRETLVLPGDLLVQPMWREPREPRSFG